MRPSLLGCEAIASRLQAIASRFEAIVCRPSLLGCEASASRLEASASSRLEAIASRLEAAASRLEAIVMRLGRNMHQIHCKLSVGSLPGREMPPSKPKVVSCPVELLPTSCRQTCNYRAH